MLLLLAHAVVGQGILAALRDEAATGGPTDQLGRFLELAAQADRLDLLAQTLLHEWLWPFAPFSVTWLLALRRGADRRRGVALLVAVAGYVLCAFLLLEVPRERGAYLLPLVLPAVLLSVRQLPAGLTTAAGLAAAILAAGQIAVHGRDPEGVAFVRDMRTAIGGQSPFVFLGPRDELNGVMRDWHTLAFQPIHEVLIFDVPPEAADLYYQHFDAYLAARWAQGHTVYLTRGAVVGLQSTPGSTHDKLYRDHLQVRYRLVPVDAGAFHALRIERRE